MIWWAFLLSVAGAVVTVSTCDEDSVSRAFMQGPGGSVILACSGTISLSSTLVIPDGTTLSVAAGRHVAFTGHGSVVLFHVGNANISDITLRDGYHDVENGACMRTQSSKNITLTNVEFINCLDGSYGGGLFLNESVNAFLQNVSFWNNTGTLGGAGLYAVGGSTVTAVDCTFEGNQGSTDRGGGALVEDCTFSCTGCKFRYNKAMYGGGLAVVRGTFTLTDALFIWNSAPGGRGGAMYIEATDGEIDDSWFFNNTAMDMGGAIYSCLNPDDMLSFRGGGVCDNMLTEVPGDWVASGIHAECDGQIGVDRTGFSGNEPAQQYAAITPAHTVFFSNVPVNNDLARSQCEEGLNVTVMNPPTTAPTPVVVAGASAQAAGLLSFFLFFLA